MPAGEIEQFVIDQIKAVGNDPALLAQTIKQARGQGMKALADLQREEQSLQRELARHNAQLIKLATSAQSDGLADIQERIRTGELRSTQIRDDIVALNRELVDECEVETALSAFTPIWDTLSPREQARIIHLLIERVDYDGANGTVSVTFRPNGIKTLAQEYKGAAA